MPSDHTPDPAAPPFDDVAPDPVLDPVLERAATELRSAVDAMAVRSPARARAGGPAPRRRSVRIVLATTLAAAVLIAAGGVIYLRNQAGELRQVHVDGLAPIESAVGSAPPPDTEVAPVTTVVSSGESAPPVVTEPTVALLTRPVNLLVVGVDTRTDGTVLGTRSDTIAIVRLDPASGRVAVLSIPRDLWVDAEPAGGASGSRRRINAFLGDDGDPSGLVAVISATFDIDINHYVAIDFDGFRDLVDLAGGVDIPFTDELRDTHTGFSAAPGCQHLDGDRALAYVRARYLQRLDPATGTWHTDPLSDFGRIARQQDLVRRLYQAVLAADYGLTDQLQILTDVVDDITVDDGLDLDALRSLFATARAIGADHFSGASLDGVVTPTTIEGNAVLVLADADGLAAIVDLFLHGNPVAAPSDSPDTLPVTASPNGAIVPDAAATC